MVAPTIRPKQNPVIPRGRSTRGNPPVIALISGIATSPSAPRNDDIDLAQSYYFVTFSYFGKGEV